MQARYVVAGATVLFGASGVSRSSGLMTSRMRLVATWVWRAVVSSLACEQDLNHANVDVLLQQMGSEAVAQRVRRHPFWQQRQFSSHVADAIELACGHWADAVAAREHPYRRAGNAPPVA
jgi:hypothetical protein